MLFFLCWYFHLSLFVRCATNEKYDIKNDFITPASNEAASSEKYVIGNDTVVAASKERTFNNKSDRLLHSNIYVRYIDTLIKWLDRYQ